MMTSDIFESDGSGRAGWLGNECSSAGGQQMEITFISLTLVQECEVQFFCHCVKVRKLDESHIFPL